MSGPTLKMMQLENELTYRNTFIMLMKESTNKEEIEYYRIKKEYAISRIKIFIDEINRMNNILVQNCI